MQVVRLRVKVLEPSGVTLDFNGEGPQLAEFDPTAWDRRLERLRAEIKSRAREIVGEIFPLARIHGSDARIGNVQGDAGESLSVGLDGERAGLWTDHATGEGGDLITLWMETVGSREFPEAVQELEDWLGIGSARPRFATKVARVAAARKEEARKAPRAEAKPLGSPSETYHYLAPDGVTVLGIVRRFELDEFDRETGKRKKTFRPQKPDGSAGMPDVRPLYRLPAVSSASEVVLVEGEKCADRLADLGIVATSQMGGSGADPAKTDWSPLAGKAVAVWQDNDAAGSGLLARVAPALEAVGAVVRLIKIPPGKPKGWDAADAVAEGLDVQGIIAVPTNKAGRRAMRMLSITDLAALKPPEWLIDGHLPEGGFASLYGPHGSLKSFVALDWALSIAHGKPWLGKHNVRPGSVVYVAGEGQAGLAPRIIGWHDAKGLPWADNFHLIPQGVALPTGELAELLNLIGESRPALIVLDTLARTFGPGDENSQKDMNAFVRAVDHLREETGACVLVIHHSGKDQERGTRGSTALPGAVDTNIFVRRKGPSLTLVNKAPHGKQKDAEEFEDLALRVQKVAFSHAGASLSTLVIMPDEDVKSSAKTDDSEPVIRLGANQKVVLALIERASKQGRGLGFTALVSSTGIDRGSLGQALRSLVEKELISESDSEPKTWMFL